MELVVLVERSIVDVLSILGTPLELSPVTRTVNVGAFEPISASPLVSLAMEFIILETSLVGHLFGLVFAIFTVSLILVELAIIKGTVREDEGSFSMSFSMIKPSQVNPPILFIHPAVTVGLHSILHISKVTSSSEPV